jgi:hypothetical protein
MWSALVVAVLLALLSAWGAHGCSPYVISSTCCNMFGKNCDGPCWNQGCKTHCEAYPGKTLACPQIDMNGEQLIGHAYYNCCPTYSACMTTTCTVSPDGSTTCCCTGAAGEIMSISDFTYDWGSMKDAPDTTSTQVTLVNQGMNDGETESGAPSLQVQVTTVQASSWSTEESTKISVDATVKANIPFFHESSIKFGAEQVFKYGTKIKYTDTIAVTIATGMDMIPPYSFKVWEFAGSLKVINVPFTARAEAVTDCGLPIFTTVKGTMQLAGIASFVQGHYIKKAGPTVPIECTSPFDFTVQEQLIMDFCPAVASAKCVDNVLCKRMGITGTCCAAGGLNGCCSTVDAHPLCAGKYPAGSVVCPTGHGIFDKCCDALAANGTGLAAAHNNATASFSVHVRLDAREQPEPNKSAEPDPTETPAALFTVPPAAVHVVVLQTKAQEHRPAMR